MSRTDRSAKIAGFTVIELVVAIAVLAILVTIALPALQEFLKNNRVTAQSNELASMVAFARNEALRRNDSIPVELTSQTSGWRGEVKDPDNVADTQGCTQGVLRCASYDRVQLTQDIDPTLNTVTLTFNNRGYLTPFNGANLTLEHEDCSPGNRQRRLIRIRPSGQVQGCTVDCGVTVWPAECN